MHHPCCCCCCGFFADQYGSAGKEGSQASCGMHTGVAAAHNRMLEAAAALPQEDSAMETNGMLQPRAWAHAYNALVSLVLASSQGLSQDFKNAHNSSNSKSTARPDSATNLLQILIQTLSNTLFKFTESLGQAYHK